MDATTQASGADNVKLYNNISRSQALAKAKAGSKSVSNEQIDKVAEDFEAVFITQMMEHMFEGIETDGAFGSGNSEEIYRSLLLDEYGKLISRAGGIGVADHVKREMLKLQEVH